MRVAHVGDIEVYLVPDSLKIRQVAAVFGNEAVDDGHIGSLIHKTSREIGADKPRPSGYQNIGVGKIHDDSRVRRLKLRRQSIAQQRSRHALPLLLPIGETWAD